MSETAIIAIRWALYVDLGPLFGLPLFALYALGGGQAARRLPALAGTIAGLALCGLALSVFGFAVQVSAMAGLPPFQFDGRLIADVLGATDLGLALKVRLVALAAALCGAMLLSRAPRGGVILCMLAGAVALATLAWSGHGAAGEGAIGQIQLAADIVHMFAAGAWLGAIVAFLLLVSARSVAQDIERVRLASRALHGFAITGGILVGLIVITGLINGALLVGLAHIATLGQSAYGRLLLAKLALFAVMLGIAALNRYRLTPALERAIFEGDARRALAHLRQSLSVEGVLAILILGLVGWLGTLAPPMAG